MVVASSVSVAAQSERFELCHVKMAKILMFCDDVIWPEEDPEYGQQNVILVPNPWRVKAQGCVIRHLYLTSHCDDTPGNISKQWNKHISYYMNISGLPSQLIHLDFITLFLEKSNTNSALELGDHVVDRLNYVASNTSNVFVYTPIPDTLNCVACWALKVIRLMMQPSTKKWWLWQFHCDLWGIPRCMQKSQTLAILREPLLLVVCAYCRP